MAHAAHASHSAPLRFVELTNDNVSRREVTLSLVAAVDGYMGNGTEVQHVAETMGKVRPLFDALPKNRYGNLGHAATRYALHRHFSQQYGVRVKGLTLHVELPEETEQMAKAHVPSYVQSFLEEQMGGTGFGLADLAVFTAALERLIHEDVLTQLTAAFKEKGHSIKDILNPSSATAVVEAFLARRVLGDAAAQRRLRPGAWPGPWAGALHLAREAASKAAHAGHGRIGFKALAKVASNVDAALAARHQQSCKQLRSELAALSGGRGDAVSLKAFAQKGAIGEQWRLTEDDAALRALGVANSSGSGEVSVLVPNYVYSSANCIETAGFYALCCPSACDEISAGVEAAIGAPEAEPGRLATVVANSTPTETAMAPIKAEVEVLSERLHEIAKWHMGAVPVHGRLFARWMKATFPASCPAPKTGVAEWPLTADEWLRAEGFLEEDVVRMYVSADGQREDVDEAEEWVDLDETQAADDENEDWADEEEVMVIRRQPATAIVHRAPVHSPALAAARSSFETGFGDLAKRLASLVFMIAAVVAMVRNLFGAAYSGRSALGSGKGKKGEDDLYWEKSAV